jgi:hypothetical protein
MKNDSQSINDVLVSVFKCAMKEKNITYRVLAKKMKCSEKTVFTYFNDKKTKRNIPYSVAVVIYFVLMRNKEFTNAEERENLQNEIDRSFYSAFRKAFDLAGKNYLKLEAEHGISHSTSYCYYTEKKAPLINSAYKISQLLNFELPYISEIINQQIQQIK